MKGILLAGGTGSRLMPLTKVINKHLLPVGAKPMIYSSLEQFRLCGIRQVMVIVGTEHMGQMMSQLGDGSEFDLDLTYAVQTKSLGIAHAIALTRDFVGSSEMMVLLGDNIFEISLRPCLDEYRIKLEFDAGIVVTQILELEERRKFGIVEMNNDRVIDIQEKPSKPKSKWVQTGCYFYNRDVWEAIDNIGISDRGEYEVTDINMWFVKKNKMLAMKIDGWWTDAGTHESYWRANRLSRD